MAISFLTKQKNVNMVLELIDVFANPYNGVASHFDGANYVLTPGANLSGINIHTTEEMQKQRTQPNWMASASIGKIPSLETYQKKYAKCNKALVDADIKKLNITMTPNQFLYHGGVLNVNNTVNSVVLTAPLSTTFHPDIALNEATYKGKAYRSNALHINVIKVINPNVKVYPFRPGSKMGHEGEVLFEAGITLNKIKDTIVNPNYDVADYDLNTRSELRKKVEAHIVEWEIV